MHDEDEVAGAAPTIGEAFPAVLIPEETEPTEEERALEAQRELSERALQHRAELLVEIAKTEGFQMVLREIATKVARMRKAFADNVFAGEEVNQRQVDYDRGYIDGLGYIDKMIEGAANTLERLDKQAAAESEPENDTEGDDLWS